MTKDPLVDRIGDKGYEDRCEHCALTMDAEDCGPREAAAQWVDPDGNVSPGTRLICLDCLQAGAPDGPGYRPVTA